MRKDRGGIELIRGSTNLAVALAAGFALAPMRASAATNASTAAEIREVKAQIRALEHRLDARAKQKRERAASTRKAPKGGSNAPALASLGGSDQFSTDAFYYKGVKITPGGYIAFDSVYRNHWLGDDIDVPFSNLPFANVASSHATEFRFSGRTSRQTLLVQGDVNPSTHLTGYIETDFLGAAQTANSNESNSYNPRMRHLYSNLDLDDLGLHVLAGQTWTLATTNVYRIRPDTAVQGPQINSHQIVGYFYPRQPQLRITQDIGKDFTVAFSAENPATTWESAGTPIVGVTNVLLPGGTAYPPVLTATPASGGLFNSATSFSFNRMPDFLGKAAWDSTILDRRIHVEGFGLLRDFTDRDFWGNHSVWAGGGGGSLVVQIVPKLLDLQASGASGYGIGRYGAGNLSDAGTTITGAPLPIHERMILIGGTLHATDLTDVWAFAGGEFQSANAQTAAWGKSVILVGGVGNSLYSNAGCNIENPVGLPAAYSVCSGQSKDVRELTGGVWQTLYAGAFGKLKVGAQYSLAIRDGFNGLGGSPKSTENSFFTSLRYYPF